MDKDGGARAANELSVAAPFWSFLCRARLPSKMDRSPIKRSASRRSKGKMEGNDFTLSGITQEGPISVKGTFQMERGEGALT